MTDSKEASVSNVSEASVQMDDKRYVVRLIELDNALLVFFNENETFSLGTLAFGMPDLGGMHHLSSAILGEKNASAARLLAERLSVSSGGMVLVSIHFASELNSTVYARVIELAETLIRKAKQGGR